MPDKKPQPATTGVKIDRRDFIKGVSLTLVAVTTVAAEREPAVTYCRPVDVPQRDIIPLRITGEPLTSRRLRPGSVLVARKLRPERLAGIGAVVIVRFRDNLFAATFGGKQNESGRWLIIDDFGESWHEAADIIAVGLHACECERLGRQCKPHRYEFSTRAVALIDTRGISQQDISFYFGLASIAREKFSLSDAEVCDLTEFARVRSERIDAAGTGYERWKNERRARLRVLEGGES